MSSAANTPGQLPEPAPAAPPPQARRVRPYGDRAVLLECPDLTDARAVQAFLARRPGGAGEVAGDLVAEVVPGARTLLLRLRAAPGDPAVRALTDALLAAPSGTGVAPAGGDVTLVVDYDGEDLAEVAELTGTDPAGVVARHTGTLWTVAFVGFAPGFGYLLPEVRAGGGAASSSGWSAGPSGELPEVPRRRSPRTRVPAGAVGLAGPFSGVYPRTGPGGWQLIGRTTATLWDLEADPPAVLRPGTRVRFTDRAAHR